MALSKRWNSMKIFVLLSICLAIAAATLTDGIAQEHVIQAGKYFFLQDYQNAIKAYEKAIKEDPKDPLLHYNLAICHEKAGDVKSAITAYKMVLKLRSDFVQAQEALDKLYSGGEGKVLQEMQSAMLNANNAFFIKDYKTAVEQYKKVVEADSQNFTAFYNLGVCQEQIGFYREAFNSYQRAIQLNPQSVATANAIQRVGSQRDDTSIAQLKSQIQADVLNDNLQNALTNAEKILAIEYGNKWALSTRRSIRKKLREQKILSAEAARADSIKQAEALAADLAEIAAADSAEASKSESGSDSESGSSSLFIILGIVLVIAIVAVVIVLQKKKQSEQAATDVQKSVYDSLQDYFTLKKTGILAIAGDNQDGENIEGEVRVLKGNIVDAHANGFEGIDALHQLLAVDTPNELTFRDVQVSSTGNIRQATLPLLMQWTLGMQKNEKTPE